VSDIDIALMDSLEVLDPEGPIREADMIGREHDVRFGLLSDSCSAANCTLVWLVEYHVQSAFN